MKLFKRQNTGGRKRCASAGPITEQGGHHSRSGHRKAGKFSVLLPDFLIWFGAFLAFLARWVFTTWSDLKMDEIMYELTAPLAGTGSSVMGDFIFSCIVPSVLVGITLLFVNRVIRKRKNRVRIAHAMELCGTLSIAAIILVFWFGLDIGAYIVHAGQDSTFIRDHYTDPAETEVTFPEKKRNLIYIYLESMEDTFADKSDGGAFDENIIPELTELGESNEDFSGADTSLNGAYAMNGATWTMGALFAETSGLPLKTSLGNNAMSQQDEFFPSITTLGDILKDNGYHNVFMLGSDAKFGGRKLYFTSHGDYDILDYNYAKEQGWIDEDYYVWWGYEDEKLFSFAKNELTELAKGDEPFNFTMLTVDTHFSDGYVCDLCGDQYDDQYANVYACSSRQVAAFVSWIQEQDFYDDTTIVISGDHPTMDGDFCSGVDSDYDRKVYTAYINADAEVSDPEKERTYTTFDDFPTTLAALGCAIDGNRLGLGTNLFSNEETLAEELGVTAFNSQLALKSSWMEEKSGVSEEALKVSEELEGAVPDVDIRTDSGNVIFTVRGLEDYTDILDRVYVLVYNRKGERLALKNTIKQDDGTYALILPVTSLDGSTDYTCKILTDSDAGDLYLGDETAFSVDADSD